MITIMTPTYNRAYILEQAYLSLKNQTCHDFEWIIIDDGSQDNTEQLVRRWMAQCTEFEIRYCKQPNGGKHRAVNRAVKMARYDWFLILDSDDRLTEHAVETIHTWLLDVADREDFAGVAGLRGSATQAIGGIPKRVYTDATNLQRAKFGLLGDKAEVYKTAVLRRYPFPEFEGENFLRESAVWDQIAKDGLMLRWYSEIIYLCEYIADGLTKNTGTETYRKNFNGFTYCTRIFLQTHSLPASLNKCGHYYHVARSKGLTTREMAQRLEVCRTFLLLSVPVFKLRSLAKTAYGKARSLTGRS